MSRAFEISKSKSALLVSHELGSLHAAGWRVDSKSFLPSNLQEVSKRDGPAPCQGLFPEYFAPLYASYADDVEFRDAVSGLVLMSISEINRRSLHLPEACVDFGFKYAGMGHVRLFTVLPETGVVVEARDGGSSDLERTYNMQARHRAAHRVYSDGRGVSGFESLQSQWWTEEKD